MNIFEIYVNRENIENEFSVFLKNKKKVIWSIYGVGGIGKSTLLNRFYEQIKEDKIASCFFDYANRVIDKVTGIEMLLYHLIVNDCKTFEKLKKIISKKHRSLSQKLDKISDTAGTVPMKNINSLITELDKDAEYTKELGLIWNTIIDTIKVGSKLFNREKKDELITNNPELHLLTALLADIEKNKRGVIFIDTYEKLKDITVSTTLHLIGNELTSSNEPYELSFEAYITLILKFIYINNDKADIKTIIAGRDRVNKIDNIGLRNIKQSKVNKFEPEQILDYLEQKDFDLPNEIVINEIQDITKGNPLILHYLTEFILLKYENQWTWDDWTELVQVFSTSDDEYGLIYYLTERIASHISGWENTLWKLTIPRVLNSEIAEILYPKKDDESVYGKKYFNLLQEKGIIRKGKGVDENYYLLDELKTSINAYTKKEFGKNGQSWTDNDKYIQINQNLADYYKNNREDAISFSNYIYHKVLTIKEFKKKSNEISKKEFADLLLGSFSLSIEEKERVLDAMPRLSKEEINELIVIFNEEKIKFSTEFFSIEVANHIRELAIKGELPANHFSNEAFFVKTIEQYPDDVGLIVSFCNLLEKNKDYDKAEEFYLKAIEANPKYENANMNLGFFYLQRGNIELSEKYLVKSVELGSSDFGNMNLGHVYLAKGEKEKALDTYKLSIANFGDKDKFIEGFVDDYQYLKQYSITEDEYNEIKNKLTC